MIRHDYERVIDGAPPTVELPDELTLRRPGSNDDAALASLMEAAYAGTIDEQVGGNADGAIEIANWRQFVADVACSRMAVSADGQIVAASLVGRWEERAFIAYVMTSPEWKGRGAAAAVLAASLSALADADETHVGATITEGNQPSERLFARFGFRRLRRS